MGDHWGVMLSCQVCGGSFTQAMGRPAKRCPQCRSRRSLRYGGRHKTVRAATVSAAYGQACTRCGGLLRPGQFIDLDHSDDGSGYLGYAHRGCNRSAGASLGNRMRGGWGYVADPVDPPPVVCQFHGAWCGSIHSEAWGITNPEAYYRYRFVNYKDESRERA
jgi:DNA-directed RNA polymerase subunit RPC12/RpoP